MNSFAASCSCKSKKLKSCQLLIHVICLFANCRVPKIDFSNISAEMLEKSIFGTRQLAKRQITWMRSWQDLSFFDLHEQEAANEFIKKGLKL